MVAVEEDKLAETVTICLTHRLILMVLRHLRYTSWHGMMA